VEYDLDATPPTPQSQSIFPGASVDLDVNPIFDSYEWEGQDVSPTQGPSVTASPTEFGAFNYTVQTEINDCPFESNFLVTVLPPISPFNAFTPNNDGFNDTWEIDRITEWPNAQILVYSRWGARVFQATNYRNDWDGDNLPAASYYYVIELNPIDFNAEPITGSVTIVR
jgi:gliding motility-associated-like protein